MRQDRGVRFELGDPVRVEMQKWGERPHWEFDAFWLGSDEHGEWVGIPAGTPMSRPGLDLALENDQVGLVPHPDLRGEDRWWIATFHGVPHPRVLVYVDIATPPRWDGPVVRTVDLDLDVIRPADGEVFVDDEDEFAEHQVSLGYPGDVIASAVRSAEQVLAAVAARHPPYDGSHDRWLATLAGLSART
jgi:uncharacterized protein